MLLLGCMSCPQTSCSFCMLDQVQRKPHIHMLAAQCPGSPARHSASRVSTQKSTAGGGSRLAAAFRVSIWCDARHSTSRPSLRVLYIMMQCPAVLEWQ